LHLENRELDSPDDLPDSGTGQLAVETARLSQQLIEVLDTIGDRIFLKDSQGRVTYINHAFLRAYGLSAAEVIGKRHEDFLPPEMVLPCQSADKSVLESGEASCLETHWQDSRTGTLRWSETLKSPLRDPAGNITGIVGISRDITDRRSTKDELKRQKTLLELIVQTVPDLVFVKDLERKIIIANKKYCEFMGCSHEDIIGQDLSPRLPPEVLEESRRTDLMVLQDGLPSHHDISRIDMHGKLQSLEIRKFPLLHEGEITGILSVCRDLTEAKQAEEQSKRNESLLLHASRLSSIGELVAGIAHEINQPLFSILNYAKAVENSLQGDTEIDVVAIRKWVQQIHKEAARGGKITQRLKSFVKRAESQQKPSDLNQVVVDSLEFLAIQARDAGLTIGTDLAKKLPTLMLDRIQIQQVLVNLLINAMESLEEHSVEFPQVSVSTRLVPLGVEVAVADNGPGVSVANDVNILDPFQTTKHDGIGLGLAISNTIIEAHQGELTYGSNDRGGATFSFTLPAAN